MPKPTKPVQTPLSRKQNQMRRLAAKSPQKRQLPKASNAGSRGDPLPAVLKANVAQAGGPSINPTGAVPGKRLLTRIREILGERSIRTDPVTKERSNNTRFDDAADAFVRRMELGEFQHVKEYIEREEGKVSNSLIVATPDQMKLFIDTPTEGPEAP